MSSKKNKKIEKKIVGLESQRKRIISELLNVPIMLRGSYALVYTKCGKDNCWCKHEGGHPHHRITWREKGQGVTRKIPQDYLAWVQEVTKSYRQFRSLRRKLVTLEATTKKSLDAYEHDLIQSTRTAKNFLAVKPQNRNKNSVAVPKKKNRSKNKNS